MESLSAYDVSLYFLFLAESQDKGEVISNLKMQKMLYYAQGHYLATTNEALFNDKIEAWTYGPVVKSVYDRFKKYRNLSIDFVELENYNAKIYNEKHLDILPFIYNKYTPFSASQLVDKTHKEAPYIKHFVPYNTNEIPQNEIKEFFINEFKKEAELY